MQRALAALTLALVLPLPALANVTVKPGDTLSEIAERHGVSLSRLMQANGITNPTQLQAGQRLVIPGRGAAAASGGGSSGARSSAGSVVVQPGDTLSEIAARHGISLQRLMQLNGISNPAMVEAGRRLALGSGGRPTSGGGNAPYTVKSGETLGELAERFNTSVSRLMQLNGISEPTQLQAGRRIAVPVSGRRPPEASASAGRAAAREHLVQPGESLSEIADAYNLPLQRLVSLNNLSDPDMLISGTRLRLTAPPPVPAARPAPKRPAAAKPNPKPAPKPTPSVAAKPKPAGTSAAASAPRAPAAKQAATTTTPLQAQTPSPTASTPGTASTTGTAAAPASTAASTTAAAQAPAAAPARRSPPSGAPNQSGAAAPASAASTPTATTPVTQQAGTKQAGTTPAPRAAATAAAPARQPRAAAAAARPAGPDWRSYGPLQVDWANWQPMGGSFVAPSLNADGQPLYTAINCGARKLNATSQAGQWRSWEAPRTDAEKQLVSDLCKAKGS